MAAPGVAPPGIVFLHFSDTESVAAWEAHPEHLEAQRPGREG